ncbi:YbaB/EbfC family nucleoid-associated protein [Patescibacteria group bacterium]|nr:YbaB/EbfC family nucleoid-associated protein [Patescibacteria group bacterium]MBU1472889.1 YbaB/EbfC family nucleoid-associated protein [Patescibacteria group bacterium]MBU2459790.1 YbaB/EbfC family nucleoid-associated protein [Patescibacteria group bacterium]MBU2544811.1 YbaB/EbfC family nucleoid-associated protein [Patescibacteria group bacterium]
MFNPLKALGDVNAMRKHAIQIQQELESEEFEVSQGGARVVISGNQNVKSVTIDGVPNEDVRRAVNDAIKRSQQAAAGKLAEISKNFQQ